MGKAGAMFPDKTWKQRQRIILQLLQKLADAGKILGDGGSRCFVLLTAELGGATG